MNMASHTIRGSMQKKRLLVLSAFSIIFACALTLIVWRQVITAPYYPNSTKVKDCTYPPVEAEANLAYSFMRFQFNHCRIAAASLSDVIDWFANNSRYANKWVAPLGTQTEYHRWENSLFGFTVAHRVYFLPPDCFIRQAGLCISTTPSDTDTSIGLFSWTSIVLYRPNPKW